MPQTYRTHLFANQPVFNDHIQIITMSEALSMWPKTVVFYVIVFLKQLDSLMVKIDVAVAL